jgi:FMN phosphatase YigB (HAD superfamily)
MKKIEADAIIFDRGNTLELNPFYDILRTHRSYLTEPLKSLGYEEPSIEKLFIKNWINADNGPYRPYESHGMQEERIIQEGLKCSKVEPQHIPIVAPEILTRYREKYAEALSNDPRREEIITALKELRERQKTMAVLSSDRDFAVRASGIYMGYSSLLDASFSSEEIGQERPKPFKYVLDKLNLDPKRTVSVGDRMIQDVNDAKELGMKAVLYVPPMIFKRRVKNRKVLWGAPTQRFKYKPDAKIRDLRELPSLIV